VEIKYEKQKVSTKTEPEVVEKVVEKVVENLSENQKLIIKLVVANNYTTPNEITLTIGISHRKVQENKAKLKEMGILKRIGSAKGGHWKIIDK
jgi:ATP-dependent DNA helicase RecG